MSRMPLITGAGDPVPVSSAPAPAADTRARIAAAAFELFAAQGYDGTTVDAIAERAGIARRTFFRYFRSKDDVIFPDHDRLLSSVIQNLAGQGDVSPVLAICGVVRLVFLSYVNDPQVSVQRYRLTRRVDALRDREMASVRKYERAFGRYLRDRLTKDVSSLAVSTIAGPRPAGSGRPSSDVPVDSEDGRRPELTSSSDVSVESGGGWRAELTSSSDVPIGPETRPRSDLTLRADVIAASVVAAHNAVLREWLRAGGGYDPMPDLETAFAWLVQTFEPQLASRPRPRLDRPDAGGRPGPESGSSDVVVAVFRADQPIGDVVERISRSL